MTVCKFLQTFPTKPIGMHIYTIYTLFYLTTLGIYDSKIEGYYSLPIIYLCSILILLIFFYTWHVFCFASTAPRFKKRIAIKKLKLDEAFTKQQEKAQAIPNLMNKLSAASRSAIPTPRRRMSAPVVNNPQNIQLYVRKYNNNNNHNNNNNTFNHFLNNSNNTNINNINNNHHPNNNNSQTLQPLQHLFNNQSVPSPSKNTIGNSSIQSNMSSSSISGTGSAGFGGKSIKQIHVDFVTNGMNGHNNHTNNNNNHIKSGHQHVRTISPSHSNDIKMHVGATSVDEQSDRDESRDNSTRESTTVISHFPSGSGQVQQHLNVMSMSNQYSNSNTPITSSSSVRSQRKSSVRRATIYEDEIDMNSLNFLNFKEYWSMINNVHLRHRIFFIISITAAMIYIVSNGITHSLHVWFEYEIYCKTRQWVTAFVALQRFSLYALYLTRLYDSFHESSMATPLWVIIVLATAIGTSQTFSLCYFYYLVYTAPDECDDLDEAVSQGLFLFFLFF